MKIAIIGLPISGKTTLFRALAAGHLPTGEANLAAVPVPDDRLDLIAQREKPRKKTYASITLVDVAAMRAGEDTSARLDKIHSLIGDADALLLTIQAFGDLNYRGDPLDPTADLHNLIAELLLTDMAIVDARFDRVAREHRAKPKSQRDVEYTLLERLRDHLDAQRWARHLPMNDEELRIVRGYGLLTMRPALVVFNVADDDLSGNRCRDAILAARSLGLPTELISAKLELELTELPDDDRSAFLAEYGLSAPARDRIIRAAYQLLDIVTFFTVNENEARAWTVPRGTTAKAAAGKIHSDMEKGFVRAEVLSFDDYRRAASLDDARRHGLIRLEGHDYIVADGDILQIRFTR